MKLLQELTQLIEEKKDLFASLNAYAKKTFGEFGIMSCSEDQIAKMIDIKKADGIAKKTFGEFGFATLDEDQAREVINSNPTLVKIRI